MSDSSAPVSRPPDIWTWLASLAPLGTLVDIGANDGAFGEFLANHLRVERAYFIEPLARLRPQIEARVLRTARPHIFLTALSDEAGTATFYENSNHPSSSLLHVSEISKREFPQTAGESRLEVPVTRLDDLLAEADLPGDIFIKIDVQGFEDRVIRGGQRVFAAARFVMIEMSFMPFYDGQPLFEEVHLQLTALGFRFAGMKNQIDSPRTGQPLFAHCLYRRT
jgi:FkbM family methyltransferase